MERALRPFGEWCTDEYEKEQTKYSKAWYDLTRGRLLAASVRLHEFEAAVAPLVRPRPGPPQTNRLSIRPFPQLRTGRVAEMQARQARELLKRCVAENPETPWQILAEWDMEHPMGIGVKQWYEPPPPPSGGVTIPVPVTRVTLPNL